MYSAQTFVNWLSSQFQIYGISAPVPSPGEPNLDHHGPIMVNYIHSFIIYGMAEPGGQGGYFFHPDTGSAISKCTK